MFKFENEIYPLCNEEIEDLKIYFNEDIEYLKPHQSIKESFKSFDYILNNAKYPLKYLNCNDKNILGLDGINKLKKDIIIINDYLLRQFENINFKNTCEEEIKAWYRFDNNISIIEVFHEEIEKQDNGILKDRDVNFPSSLKECRIIENDIYIPYYLIMDRMRPRTSQIKASKEIFIKDGLLKYNKLVEEKQEKNKKSFSELLEKEKQKRYNTIVNFQNRYFSINRLTNLLFLITSHFSGCIYEDINIKNNKVIARTQTQKLINKIENTFNYVVSFNDIRYKLEVI